MLDYQTPTELVPKSPELEEVAHCPGSESAQPMGRDGVQQAQGCLAQSGTGRKTPGVDQHWHEKYDRSCWFQFTPAKLAAWYNERYDITDIIEFDAHGMANASIIGRPERTPSLAYTKDRKRFTDFGASARRADGKPDGGDVLELRVRVNAAQDGMSKAETLRQIGRQLKEEARQALESAAQYGEQPPQWVQAFMSPTGWEHYQQLRNEAGRANTEPEPHTGGVAGFSPNNTDLVGKTHTSQGQRQRRKSAQSAPPETHHPHETGKALKVEQVSLQELEVLRDYGWAHEWPALVIDGEEIIPAGRVDWLEFVWLSHQHEQQRRVYEWIRCQC